MTFEDIHRVLGRQIVERLCDEVRNAYVAAASGGSKEGPVALQDLLIAMLVSVTVTPTNRAISKAVTDDCCRRYQELADATRRAYAGGHPPPTDGLH